MPVFNDSENKTFTLLPDGDYVFCVKEFEIGISSGGKTNGSDKYSLELEIEGKCATVLENLIDHESCAWKLDTFLKACGVKLAKGEAYEFRRDKAQSSGVRWIHPLGFRGWCRLRTEEYEKNGEKKKVNKVACFYTDKAKLPARTMADAADDEDNVPFS